MGKNIVKALIASLPDIIKEISKPYLANISLEIIAEAARNQNVAEPFLVGENEFKSELIGLLEQGKKNGFVNSKVDIPAFVHVFVNLLDGLCESFAFSVNIPKRRLVKSLENMIFASQSP